MIMHMIVAIMQLIFVFLIVLLFKYKCCKSLYVCLYLYPSGFNDYFNNTIDGDIESYSEK